MKLFQTGMVVLINALVTVLLINLFQPSSPNDQVIKNNIYKLNQSEENLVELVAAANPAVLSIVVSQDVPIYERYLREFGPFGFVIPDQRAIGSEERQIGSGSGFIVSSDGLVVTNRHVVDSEGAEYVGITSTGDSYELELVELDSMLDIAVLRIVDPPKDLEVLEFGDSDQLRLGQSVVAIGNALGKFSNSISVGIVSGLSRSIVAGSTSGDRELLENVIQTDAAINPGNSGGPLLNLAGQVIGVNVAVASGSENIAFSIPSNIVSAIVLSIQESGRIIRPYLGVRYVMVNESIKEEFDLAVDEGALVIGSGEGFAVDPKSPAANAGLREGDVIIKINDQIIGSGNSLASSLRRIGVGELVELVINRAGQEVVAEVELVEFKAE